MPNVSKILTNAVFAGPYVKEGYIGGVSQTVATVMLWALAHSPSRGVWGHAPPENLDSLRAILRHSNSHYH